MIKKIILAVILILIVMQFIPADRSNPPVTADFDGPAAVSAILRTSCYNCHSNETVWPWYSRIAPVSFIIADHVEEARGHLNFSEWGNLPADRQKHAIGEMMDEIAEGEMPLSGYVRLHPVAKVGPPKLDTLAAWAKAAGVTAGETEEH